MWIMGTVSAVLFAIAAAQAIRGLLHLLGIWV
jgi:hypothetical protein